jgi:hypothetical protein
MDEDEEFKTRENNGHVQKALPSIHGKKSNEFFNADEFTSQDNIENKDGIAKSVTPIDEPNTAHKKVNKMVNTADKLDNFDDDNSNSIRNGTISESDHKDYSKTNPSRVKPKVEQDPITRSKSMKSDAKHEIKSEKEEGENEIIHKERKKCPKLPPRATIFINKILENNAYIIFMTVVTIYALFGDDFRLLLSPKSSDEVFWSLTVVALFFFSAELVMASLAQKDYFLGFYFWLDLIATVSLITDIGWIYNEITGGGDISASNASQASSLARAGRSARVGTRAGRIVRLVRLIRIVKLYKHAHKALEKESSNDDEMTPDELEQIHNSNNEADVPKESHVGRQLSDLTTRRVIVIVLIMMFSVPILSLDTYIEDPSSFKYGLQLIASFSDNPGGDGWNTAFQTFISESKSTRNPVVSLNANDISTFDNINPSIDEFRTIEVLVATFNGNEYVSVHDNRKNTRLGAGLGIGRTLFI